MARCIYASPETGEQCECHALVGREMCFQHDPSVEMERLAARSKGGKALHQRYDAIEVEPVQLETAEDLLELHKQVIAALAAKVKDRPHDADAAAKLSMALDRYLKARKAAYYEKDLQELKKAVFGDEP